MQSKSGIPGAENAGALIFDCDGTLANTAAVHYRAWAATFGSLGGKLTQIWYAARTGISGAELIQQFAEAFEIEIDGARLTELHASRFFEYLPDVQANQWVATIAREAWGRIPMSVASGGRRELVEATLKAIDLRDLFDVVVTLEDVRLGKPAPDLFLEAARRMKVEPACCVVYEDSDVGIQAAKTAGMRVIDVRRDGNRRPVSSRNGG